MDTQGLRSVVAARSAITSVDGDRGELRYRGYPIEELAEHCSFEAVAYLIWHGDLPSRSALDGLTADLDAGRRSADMSAVLDTPAGAHPLDALRYAVSGDALHNPLVSDNSPDANLSKARQFAARFPVWVAALHRRRLGLAVVPPPSGTDTATAFLTMLRGAEPAEAEVRTFNGSLVLHADHELNASTFAARVTIATQSTLHAAVSSALGTLAGPRHGGASDRVIAMLEEIGTPDEAERWTYRQLTAHQRIMGFGHAVYRTVDPRARVLRRMAGDLLAGTPHEPWLPILDVVGRVVAAERNLFPNVDLYAAIVNHELGIHPSFYSAVFACSRIVGWTAHAMEGLDGRLIRPSAAYVGPPPRTLEAVHA